MSSAASESSGTGASSSSGRSSPDDFHSMHQQHNSHAFSPFGAAFPPRRSSTPATAFLPPRFWQASSQQQQQQPQHQHPQAGAGQASKGTSGHNLQQSHSHSGEPTMNAPHNTFINLPRRTSFGTVLGGNRLGALTALGISPTSPFQGTKTPTQSSGEVNPFDLTKKSSSGGLAQEGALSSADSTPAPSMPSSPVQKPQKTRTVYLPGPDGICVESRPRRRSDAQR